MPTVAAQVATIQGITWANYPAVQNVGIYTYQPGNLAQVPNGAIAAASIRVVLRGTITATGLPFEKHFMVFPPEAAATVTAICQAAGTLMGNMAAGTDTSANHLSVDRGYTLDFRGGQIQ